MKNTSSSNRYSDAIFEIASQDDNLSEWGDFLNELSEIFKDRKIQKFFLDPKIFILTPFFSTNSLNVSEKFSYIIS